MDLRLDHLLAELARIDILIRLQVRRWQRAGRDPNDNFQGLYVSDADAKALMDRPLGSNWGQSVQWEPGEADFLARAQAEADQRVHQLVQEAQREPRPLRLENLARSFELDRFEQDALLICLAPALDLRYERIYGYLQDDVTRKRPSVNLVLDMLCGPGLERLTQLARFYDGAPLMRNQILARVPENNHQPLLSQSLSIDETILKWLLGNYYQPNPDLSARLVWPAPEQPGEIPLHGHIKEQLSASSPDRPVYVFHGKDSASQEAAARWFAAYLARPLLSVDLAASRIEESSIEALLRLALRDACLVGAIPYLQGWDGCLEDGAPRPELLAKVYEFPGAIILASEGTWLSRGVVRERRLIFLDFPTPVFAQRRAQWDHFLGQLPPGSLDFAELEAQLDTLAGQFLLTTGQISDAVSAARDQSRQAGRPVRSEDLFAAARAHSNPRLSNLARKILPRYGWHDLVLPSDQQALLREIVATVRGRPLVLESWGVGQKLVSSRGMAVLFSGPPGTGKTMAAEVIAGELGLDLYKIDLSTVVSKYIGETEKNLERIFGEAEASNAILFFDEADALFGKRSEVRDSHDRYANIEISYLLQRMEAYDGLTILATNLRANLDEAFTRRLQFAVAFPLPNEADRLRIWQTLLPPDVPHDPQLDLAYLSQRFKLAGGNIRNILVGAAYLAASDGGVVTMAHLLHGTRRELQKMGRLVDEEKLFE